jgi:LPXTG-site transpeptidase (sortase) family protein
MGRGQSSDGQRARLLLISLAGFFLVLAIGGIAYAGYELALPRGGGAQAQSSAAEAVTSPTPATTTPSAAPTPTSASTPFFAARPYHMTIDKIGVSGPVVAEGMDANQVPIVPLEGDVVAWYDFSAQPGTAGNAVFAGHKTWNGPAIFYNVDELQRGDTIRLTGDDGAELNYTVTDSFTVNENDPNAVSVMAPTKIAVMTIITCEGTRYYTGDPVFGHDYTERRIIRAEPTGVTTTAAGQAQTGRLR